MKIITLCGSSRFINYFAWMQWEIEKRGNLALGLHLIPSDRLDDVVEDHLAEYDGVADIMDALHLKKIDMSDEILALLINGYLGDSTTNEINHALSVGLPVYFVRSEIECAEYYLRLEYL